MLPDAIKAPATTALWEQALDDIAQGRGDLDTFTDSQTQWISDILQQAKQQAGLSKQSSPPFGNHDATTEHACPECDKPLRRRKGKNGFFWGCSDYPDCKTTRPDNRGKPGDATPRTTSKRRSKSTQRTRSPEETHTHCPLCKSGNLVQRTAKKGKNTGKPFIGCTAYPTCKHFSWPAT